MAFLTIDVLPPELKKAVESFHPTAVGEGWDSARGAYDNCMYASDEFIKHLDNLELCGSIEHYSLDYTEWSFDEVCLDIERLPFDIGPTSRCHWAVRSMGFIIDWTARQFEERANFPAIWRITDDDRESTRRAVSEEGVDAEGDCGIHCLCVVGV